MTPLLPCSRTLVLLLSLLPSLSRAYVEVEVVPDDSCMAVPGGTLDTFNQLKAEVEANMNADPDFGASFDDFVNATKALSIAFTARQISPFLLLNTSDFTIYLNVTEPPNNFIGPDGTYTDIVEETHLDVTAFWASTGEINPEPIPFKGVHGSDVGDLSLVELALLYARLGVVSGENAENFANVFNESVYKYFPGAYDNPLFTFNALFIKILDTPQFNWGDGIIRTTVEKGDDFGTFALAIEAHEFGHYIQNQIGLFPTVPLPSPSAWRYLELQADGTIF